MERRIERNIKKKVEWKENLSHTILNWVLKRDLLKLSLLKSYETSQSSN